MSDTYSGSQSPDLNLHTLIDSVERDIELLEQLENGSGRNVGSYHQGYNSMSEHSELILPASAKLLNLPGYKPRTINTKQQQQGIYHFMLKTLN